MYAQAATRQTYPISAFVLVAIIRREIRNSEIGMRRSTRAKVRGTRPNGFGVSFSPTDSAANPATLEPTDRSAHRWRVSPCCAGSSPHSFDRHEPSVMSLLQHRRAPSARKWNVTVTDSSWPAAARRPPTQRGRRSRPRAAAARIKARTPSSSLRDVTRPRQASRTRRHAAEPVRARA